MASSSLAHPRRAGQRRDWTLQLLTVTAAVVVWELLSRLNVLPSDYFPPVTTILVQWAQLVAQASFWSQIWDTMLAWLLGMGISFVLGTALGIVMGSSAIVYRLLRPVVEALRPVPPVVFIPIMILILGINSSMSIALIVQGAIWPILIQTMYGVWAIDEVATETVRSYRVPSRYVFLHLRLMGALPFIATGVRLSASIALIVAIVSELVGGAPGLGNALLVAQSSGAIVLMYAIILTTGVLGVIINLGLRRAETSLLFWAPGYRTEAS